MNAQQEAVALWKFLESRGFRPSIRSVGRALRDQKVRFREADLYRWLEPFQSREASRKQSPDDPEAKIEITGSSTPEDGKQPGSDFARAAKVSLPSNPDPSDQRTPPKRSRRVKQQAFELGAETPPEIDHDKSRFSMPENLPEFFPDPVDELREVATAFAQVFAYAKKPEKIVDNARKYTDTLAIMRQKGVTVAAAWQAFIDAVRSQDWKPLFGAQSKKALAYLASTRRPFTPSAGPRVDSCGCALPPGVVMPRLQKGETAHWDGDEFLFGSDNDPR